MKDSEWIFYRPNLGKLVKISFLEKVGVFSQKKWGTNKIEYVCICHGHPWVSGHNSIPTLTNYHLPLLELVQIRLTTYCIVCNKPSSAIADEPEMN